MVNAPFHLMLFMGGFVAKRRIVEEYDRAKAFVELERLYMLYRRGGENQDKVWKDYIDYLKYVNNNDVIGEEDESSV